VVVVVVVVAVGVGALIGSTEFFVEVTGFWLLTEVCPRTSLARDSGVDCFVKPSIELASSFAKELVELAELVELDADGPSRVMFSVRWVAEIIR
jgi:hypothetical protein